MIEVKIDKKLSNIMFTNSERLIQKSSFAAFRQKLPLHASMAAVREKHAYFNSPDGPKVDFEKGYDLTRSDLEEKWATCL